MTGDELRPFLLLGGRGAVDRKDSDGVCEGGRGSGEVEKDCAVVKVPQWPFGYGRDLTCPDLLLKTNENCIYMLELIVGFETNLYSNANNKMNKCARSVSVLGVFRNVLETCDSPSTNQQY